MAITMIAAFSVVAKAQKGSLQVSPGVELGLPKGQFADGVRTGFGINGKAMFGITGNAYITGITRLHWL